MSKESLEDTLCTLLAARTLIDVEGWWNGKPSKAGRGTHCPVTAICFLNQPDSFGAFFKFSIPAQKALEEAIDLKHIPTWNDAPGRTKAQVLAAFDKAISKLERESDGWLR